MKTWISCSVFLCYILSFCILLPSHMGALWVRYVSPMGSIWVPSGSHGCHGPWVLRVPMGYHGFPWEICIVKQFLMKSYQNLSKTHSKYLCYDKKQKFCPHPMLTSIWPGKRPFLPITRGHHGRSLVLRSMRTKPQVKPLASVYNMARPLLNLVQSNDVGMHPSSFFT